MSLPLAWSGDIFCSLSLFFWLSLSLCLSLSLSLSLLLSLLPERVSLLTVMILAIHYCTIWTSMTMKPGPSSCSLSHLQSEVHFSTFTHNPHPQTQTHINIFFIILLRLFIYVYGKLYLCDIKVSKHAHTVDSSRSLQPQKALMQKYIKQLYFIWILPCLYNNKRLIKVVLVGGLKLVSWLFEHLQYFIIIIFI